MSGTFFPPQALLRDVQTVKDQEHVIWAAYRHDDERSIVGRYDTKAFRWLGRQTLDNLQLETKDICVDEGERQIYVIYHGHLLRVPLSKEVHTDQTE